MTCFRLRHLVWAATFAFGCADDHVVTDVLDAAIGVAPEGGISRLPADCVDDGSHIPSRLECTGLYDDFATRQVAAGVREFAPAVWLWSDGADKSRWIQLPPGTKIDTSDPAEWKFPVGTKTWKEFRHNGKRMETRFYYKTEPDFWINATYAWRDNETRTQKSFGELVAVDDGSTYVIPTQADCDECHKGRKDRLLGFEAPLLGLPGATGITLDMLVKEGLLTHPPAKVSYEMPDDGTGLAKQVLPWMHVNCGVSCHNEGTRSKGNGTGLFLRIHPLELEAKPIADWNLIKTTIKVEAHLAQFAGRTRILPGSPEESLIYNLASTRGTGAQMPLIATRVVDTKNVDLLREWIRARARLEPDAGGPVVTPPDAAVPNEPPDGGVPDIDGAVPAAPDAEAPDAGLADPDAAAADAAEAVDGSVPPAEPDAAVPPAEEPDAYVAPAEDAYVAPAEEPDAYVPPAEPDAYVAPVDPAAAAPVPAAVEPVTPV
jgi:hypothetical protein